MEITAPQNQITTLADLDLLISQKRQLVSTLEADFINLQKVTIAENYTIRQLLNQKAELEDKTTELETNTTIASANLVELQKQLVEIAVKRDNLTAEVADKSKAQTIQDIAFRIKSEEIEKQRVELVAEQTQLGADRITFTEDYRKLDENVAKIRDCVANLL